MPGKCVWDVRGAVAEEALGRGEGSEVARGRAQVVEGHTGGVGWLHKHLDQGSGYKGHLQTN